MNHLVKIMVAACLLFCSVSPAHAEELTPAKKADIRKLFEVMHISRIADQMATLTSQSLRQSLRSCNNCTQQTFNLIERETLGLYRERADSHGGLIERMTIIYDRHFSHAEIQQLLVFYTTPLGKRVLTETPLIAQEGLIAGQQWGQSLNPDLETRFKAAFAQAKLPMPAVSSSSQTR
ncbi:MAG TPA: DUF2059 domain-containing protein [Rhodocyclaceae bacterium]|nr:DUF2059 domain-containing protein [Rhodocyclaceae bacterium]